MEGNVDGRCGRELRGGVNECVWEEAGVEAAPETPNRSFVVNLEVEAFRDGAFSGRDAEGKLK